LSEKLHQARKEERDAAQQCLKVIRVRTLLKHEPHDRKSHYFTITAASGSLYLLASNFFIKNSNEQANRNFRKYSYFSLSKHNKTDHPFKSQKNSYKKKGREIQDPRQRSHSSCLRQMTRHRLVSLRSNREADRIERIKVATERGRRKQRRTNQTEKTGVGAQAVQLMQRRVLAADANADWTAMPSESSLVDL
jgi:hypothetical protein